MKICPLFNIPKDFCCPHIRRVHGYGMCDKVRAIDMRSFSETLTNVID